MGVALPAARSSSVAESVSIHPGSTQLTVMPCRATSRDRLLARPTKAALAAEYAQSPATPHRPPVVELIKMMRE